MASSEDGATALNAASGGREKRDYVQRVFSEIAPRYDLLNHTLSLNIDRAWRRRAIAMLDWRRNPAGLYVDLCAGTLDVAVMLAANPGFAGRVIGADFAEPMLRHGVAKAAGRRVSPVVSDALVLPLADGTAAGAIVAFGIRNVVDLDAALREVHRVLAPRARFVILEFMTPSNRLLRSLYHLYFHRVLPTIGGLVSGHPTAYRYLPESVAHFPGPSALAERMRAAGFIDVRWTPLTFGIAAIHSGIKS
ncbi:MAG TPA: ubiquinone/menaquinone biosynthesis methyltransferase [Gemmatimonadaceae bacterium]|jgi:demethylmenaquinone methyltransferase/2-methoxy-6-polyprenyl-1,4-benzoquinol methylase